MSDGKVLVPQDKLIEALRLLTLAGHNVEATILAGLAQPSDGALANEGAEPAAWMVSGGGCKPNCFTKYPIWAEGDFEITPLAPASTESRS